MDSQLTVSATLRIHSVPDSVPNLSKDEAKMSEKSHMQGLKRIYSFNT